MSGLKRRRGASLADDIAELLDTRPADEDEQDILQDDDEAPDALLAPEAGP